MSCMKKFPLMFDLKPTLSVFTSSLSSSFFRESKSAELFSIHYINGMILQSRIYFLSLIIFVSLLSTSQILLLWYWVMELQCYLILNRLGKIATCYAICIVFQTIFRMLYCISAFYQL